MAYAYKNYGPHSLEIPRLFPIHVPPQTKPISHQGHNNLLVGFPISNLVQTILKLLF